MFEHIYDLREQDNDELDMDLWGIDVRNEIRKLDQPAPIEDEMATDTENEMDTDTEMDTDEEDIFNLMPIIRDLNKKID